MWHSNCKYQQNSFKFSSSLTNFNIEKARKKKKDALLFTHQCECKPIFLILVHEFMVQDNVYYK